MRPHGLEPRVPLVIVYRNTICSSVRLQDLRDLAYARVENLSSGRDLICRDPIVQDPL